MHASVVTQHNIVMDAYILRRLAQEEAECKVKEELSLLAPPSSSSSSSFLSSSSTTPLLPPLQTQWNDMCGKRKKQCDANDYERNVTDTSTVMYFECEIADENISERTFHAMNVVPFGLRSPTEVFATRGRHTNKGLIVTVLSNGLFEVLPYDNENGQPLQVRSNTICKDKELFHRLHDSPSEQSRELQKENEREQIVHAIRDRCCSSDVAEEICNFFSIEDDTINNKNNENSKSDTKLGKIEETDTNIKIARVDVIHEKENENNMLEIWELRDLQLPDALTFQRSGPCASPVHPVNSRVLARRFGCRSTLHLATVLCAYYDISYALQYDSDGAVDVGVLHSDTILFSSTNVEQYKVRDHVLVRLKKQVPALILDALGNEQYRVMLEQPHTSTNSNRSNNNTNNYSKLSKEKNAMSMQESVHVLIVGAKDILHLIQSFPEALHSPPYILHWFKQLDKSGRGHVCWKDARQFMQSWETFSVPLSFQRIGELLREVCVHKRHVEPQLLRKMPMHDDEMQLCYNEFEYLILRAQNLM